MQIEVGDKEIKFLVESAVSRQVSELLTRTAQGPGRKLQAAVEEGVQYAHGHIARTIEQALIRAVEDPAFLEMVTKQAVVACGELVRGQMAGTMKAMAKRFAEDKVLAQRVQEEIAKKFGPTQVQS